MRKLWSLCLLAMLASCATYDEPMPMAADGPTLSSFASASSHVSLTERPPSQWWRLYQDPELNALVSEALLRNADLRIAHENVLAAKAAVGVAKAQRLPELSASAEGLARSEPGGLHDWKFDYGVGGFLSFDLDLFGRLESTIKMAEADAQSIEFARADLQTRIIAEVVSSYFAICHSTEALAVLDKSIAAAEERRNLLALLTEHGAAAQVSVTNARAEVARLQSERPSLASLRSIARIELAALLGATLGENHSVARLSCERTPSVNQPLPVGSVTGLIQRRPDIARAERLLAAASAKVGVRTAELYPAIAIGASAARHVDTGGFGLSLGPLLSFHFPDTNGARSRLKVARHEARASLATFDGAIIRAIKETEQALQEYVSAQERRRLLIEAEEEAEEALRLSQLQFEAGSLGSLEVLYLQSRYTDVLFDRVQEAGRVARAQVRLFHSLGGGWSDSALDDAELLVRDNQ